MLYYNRRADVQALVPCTGSLSFPVLNRNLDTDSLKIALVQLKI